MYLSFQILKNNNGDLQKILREGLEKVIVAFFILVVNTDALSVIDAFFFVLSSQLSSKYWIN